MSQNVIAVDVRYKKGLECLAGGTVYPGFLCEKSAGTLIAHSRAGKKASFIADYIPEESISDAYSSGEWMKYFPVEAGDRVLCYLTTTQTITAGDEVTSAGNGYVKEASSGATAVGGSSNYLTITPVPGKLVHVKFVDPDLATQSLSVTLSGNLFTVSLATDGSKVITSTPALIKAAIEAVTNYDLLIDTIAATGTGAVSADDEIFEADEVFGVALEDVTTTSAAARLLVEVGV